MPFAQSSLTVHSDPKRLPAFKLTEGRREPYLSTGIGFALQSLRMSSPARSSASATSAGCQGGGVSGNVGFGDDASPYHYPTDPMSAHDQRKEEALVALKSELMAALQKEVKSLDEDSWKFARPRSQIHLISRPGGYQHKFTGRDGNANHVFKQTRDI